MVSINCRHFNGYKPCTKNLDCGNSCSFRDPVEERILVIHLEALGAVLRATSILPSIKARYPKSQITWITQAPAHHLLLNIPAIDRILTTKEQDLLALRALSFDMAFCIDKSLKATGLLHVAKSVKEVRGFIANDIGGIIPANVEAKELWELGLSNNKKFFQNNKTECQLLVESLALGRYEPKTNEYQVFLSEEESRVAEERKFKWSQGNKKVVGINTGCSPTIPYKKLSVEGHRSLINEILSIGDVSVVLLGGPEDTERNQAISAGLDVFLSPTDMGLRDGLSSVMACDIVISGDSLGMHMAIGLKKYVVAWFGPTCSQEIELYDRGEKILSAASCSPCWRRSCHNSVMCYDLVKISSFKEAVKRGISWRISSFKRPLLETYFFPSRP